jgi:hypothetical protein
MDENDLILEIEKRQKELGLTFVNGLSDWDTYQKLVGTYQGLAEAKHIIHEVYIRLNNGDSTDADEETE